MNKCASPLNRATGAGLTLAALLTWTSLASAAPAEDPASVNRCSQMLACGSPAAAAPAPPCCPAAEAKSCAAPASAANPTSAAEIASKWGIQITALRLSATGVIIDFRYRVLDAQKAAAMGKSNAKPVLIHQESGRELRVPSMPKVGALRAKSTQLAEGRTFIALFANPGRLVKPGQKVTLVFGEFRAENLTVEG